MKRFLLALLVVAALNARADVTGALVSPDGKPVAGARVELVEAEPFLHVLRSFVDRKDVQILEFAESDAKGNFTLANAERGNYVVTARRSGYAPVSLQTNGVEDLGGVLLRPAEAKKGRVTANGKPLASERLLFSAGDTRLVVTTDDKGSYSIPDPAVWKPSVYVSHPGFAMHEEQKTLGDAIRLDIAMKAGITLRGRVLDARGKSGVQARLFVDGLDAGESAGDGTFIVEHVAPDWQELIARSGVLTARARPGKLDTLRLAGSFAVSGEVLDAQTRMPLPGAGITIAADRFYDSPITAATADAKGRFILEGLLPGNYSVQVEHAGYRTFIRTQDIADATTLKPAVLQPRPRFTGRVLNDRGEPVAAAQLRTAASSRNVFFHDDSVQVSAPDGRYVALVSAYLVERGEVEVEARASGFAPTADGPHTLITGGRETRRSGALPRRGAHRARDGRCRGSARRRHRCRGQEGRDARRQRELPGALERGAND